MNSNNKLKVRYHDLDALRSFAMILGIAIHGVFSFNGMPIWPAQDINQNPQYGVVAEFIHGFRMQLFFLISGFFTAMMLLKKGSFAVSMHRTKRILIASCAWHPKERLERLGGWLPWASGGASEMPSSGHVAKCNDECLCY